jgi:hypothetical protein
MGGQSTQPSGTNGSQTSGTDGSQTPGQPTKSPANSQAVKQNVTEITNATIALLKAVGVQNTQDLQPLGEAIGLAVGIAEMATINPVGIAAGVATLVSSIVSLLNSSSPANPDATALASIQQVLKAMEQSDAANNLATRLSNIQDYFFDAYTPLDNLTTLMKGPPLTADAIVGQLTPIQTALGKMAPPDVFNSGCAPAGLGGSTWNPPSAYQAYWDDTGATFSGGTVVSGYGPQYPPNYDPQGSIFNYTCILPMYLQVISIFLGVGTALDKDFVADQTPLLRNIICLLQSVYGYIYNNGLKQLTPGTVTSETLTTWYNTLVTPNRNNSYNVMTGVTTYSVINYDAPDVDQLPDETLVGLQIEYGVVELYSGYSSVAILTLDTPFDPGVNYSSLFQIRQKKRWKDVYVGTGLLAISNAINTLNGLFQGPEVFVGPPPPPPPTLTDWSFSRDIRPTGIARSDGTIHVSDLLSLLTSQYLLASSVGHLRAVLDYSVPVTT